MKSGSNYFFDKERFRIIDTMRLAYTFLFLISFGLTEVGRYVYRPYVYENNINDFGIADSMGNLGGIVVQIFFGLAIFNSSEIKGYRLVAFLVVGYIVYEFLQLILPKGVFDWKDIIGTFLGGIIGLVLFVLLHRVIKKSNVIYRF